jgi:integrase
LPGDKNLGDIIDMHLGTGCRIGEVLALRWADVDFENGTVTVNGTIVQLKGRGTVRQPKPKSDSSRRTLRLPVFVLEMLARRSQESSCDLMTPVFSSRTGSWKAPHNVRTQWREARAGTALEWVTPHTFRKTVATEVRRQRDLGTAHSSERVTDDHYVEEPDEAPDVTEVLDQLAP